MEARTLDTLDPIYAAFPAHVPASKVVRTGTIAHGTTEVIEGLSLVFCRVRNDKADNMVTICMPDQKILIAQDLLSSNCHLICGHGNVDGWIARWQTLHADTSVDLVLPGYGPTTGHQRGDPLP